MPRCLASQAAYTELLGAKRCLATASGTTALIVGMHVLDVDAGDEVIVSPFTFIASYNAILLHKALPVFADTDPATLTMDPASIESRITDRTRALMPVHIYGLPCDMDPIVGRGADAPARGHRGSVSAWLADYKGKKCGTIGDLGCFSFQNSKHLPSGERGAGCRATATTSSIGRDRSTTATALRQLQGRAELHARRQLPDAALPGGDAPPAVRQAARRHRQAPRQRGTALRIAEGNPRHRTRAPAGEQRSRLAPLPVQVRRLKSSRVCRVRSSSRRCERKGFPVSAGYREQQFDGLLEEALASRGFTRLFSERRLKAYRDSLQDLKGTRQVCATTVAVTQNLLLAEPSDIDHIAAAIRKIQAHGAQLTRT